MAVGSMCVMAVPSQTEQVAAVRSAFSQWLDNDIMATVDDAERVRLHVTRSGCQPADHVDQDVQVFIAECFYQLRDIANAAKWYEAALSGPCQTQRVEATIFWLGRLASRRGNTSFTVGDPDLLGRIADLLTAIWERIPVPAQPPAAGAPATPGRTPAPCTTTAGAAT
jgi:hypothetical protein